jgi:hypothetical protein
MAVTTIGLTTLFFGTALAGSQVVSSYEETIKSEPVELGKGDGTFQAVVFANPQTTINGTIISGSATGAVGSASSLFGATFLTGAQAQSSLYIDNISRTATNDGFTETTISAIGWLNLNSAT